MLRSSLVKSASSKQELPENAAISKALQPHLKEMGKLAKRAMPFVQLVRDRFLASGPKVFDSHLDVDEESVLMVNYDYLTATLGLASDGLEVTESQTHFVFDRCQWYTFDAFFRVIAA